MRIILAGFDGTGKTLTSRSLRYLLSKLYGINPNIMWVKSSHGIAYIVEYIFRHSRSCTTYVINPHGIRVYRTNRNCYRRLGSLWLILEFLGLLYVIFESLINRFSHKVVIFERSFIDTVVSITYKLGNIMWYYNSFLGRMLHKWINDYGVGYLLDSSVNDIISRRHDIEYTTEEIIYLRAIYRVLARIYNYRIMENKGSDLKNLLKIINYIVVVECKDKL